MNFKNTLVPLTLFLAAGLAFAQEPGLNPARHHSSHPIMHFTREWMREHHARRKAMPVHRASPGQIAAQELPVAMTGAAVNLLSYLNLNACGGASGWDQGQCGNCWVWGSTAACSIDAGVALGSSQLFSTQWFDSDYYATQGDQSACDGGDSSMFATWYNSYPKFIPWTNSNAAYADGSGPSAPATAASAIGTVPNVPVTAITATQIPTATVSQAQAIANIKAVLDANQAVVLAFFLPSAGWTDFDNAWERNSETTPWAGVDSYNGTTMDSGGGGHLVAIVGYDNTTNAWIARNSWGVTEGRPDGTFELSQTMGYGDQMNYDGEMYIYEFDTFEPTGWGGAVIAPAITTQPASQTINVGQSAKFNVVASGSTPLSYQWSLNGTAIAGATDPAYTTPAATAAGTSTFAVTVSNSAGSATSGNATLTVNPPAVSNQILNGNFEQGSADWITARGIIGQNGPAEPAYSGTWDAWFGGSTSQAWSTLAQNVAIPGNITTAALNFYLHIDTRQSGSAAIDAFIVQVRSNGGQRLQTLEQWSNLDAASGYTGHTLDLSSYKGQTVQVSFSAARQSAAHNTSFVLDNVSLNCQ